MKNRAVKNNATIIPIESQHNEGNISMTMFPAILEEAICNWRERMKAQLNTKYFLVYEELGKLVGLAPSTLRSYTAFNPEVTPTITHLISICSAINDNTPLEFINDYQRALFNKGDK